MHRLPLLALLLLNAGATKFQIEANIRYAPSAQTVLDIYQPRAPALKNRVGVIVIHDKDSSKEAAGQSWGKAFVERGWVVAALEYRADQAEDDVWKATQWFLTHAAEYRVDPRKIVACGEGLARSLANRDGIFAAIIILNDATWQATRGAPPILTVTGASLTDSVFVWLKKHKIQ